MCVKVLIKAMMLKSGLQSTHLGKFYLTLYYIYLNLLVSSASPYILYLVFKVCYLCVDEELKKKKKKKKNAFEQLMVLYLLKWLLPQGGR